MELVPRVSFPLQGTTSAPDEGRSKEFPNGLRRSARRMKVIYRWMRARGVGGVGGVDTGHLSLRLAWRTGLERRSAVLNLHGDLCPSDLCPIHLDIIIRWNCSVCIPGSNDHCIFKTQSESSIRPHQTPILSKQTRGITKITPV